VFGVCRGMHFVNVALGGRMLQDLRITIVEHDQDGERSRFHTVDVAPGTRIAAIAGGEGTVRVNSRHHQGLRAEHVAREMRVSAVAPDGVVESVEPVDGRFVVGVRFHPELPGEVPEVAPIFEVLVAHARGR